MKGDLTPVVFLTVFERYKSYSPYDIEESIRKEVKGDLERSFLTLGNAATPVSCLLCGGAKNASSANLVSSQWSASKTDNSTSPTDSATP